MQTPNIIEDASVKSSTERQIQQGILQDAMLTTFQRGAMDGLIQSAMPMRKDKMMTKVQKVKPGATKKEIGVVRYGGSKFL